MNTEGVILTQGLQNFVLGLVRLHLNVMLKGVFIFNVDGREKNPDDDHGDRSFLPNRQSGHCLFLLSQILTTLFVKSPRQQKPCEYLKM